MRNTVAHAEPRASAGLAIAERTGPRARILSLAMVVGYEAAGRVTTALRAGGGGRPAFTPLRLVAFSGAVEAAKLLKLTDEQMAHAIGITAITMGGLGSAPTAGPASTWARTRPSAASTPRSPPAADTPSTTTSSKAPGGFFATCRRRADKAAIDNLTRDIRQGLGHHQVPRDQARAGRSLEPCSSKRRPTAGASGERAGRRDRQDPGQGRRTGRGIDNKVPKDMMRGDPQPAYFVASGVADKDFSWIHATPTKFRPRDRPPAVDHRGRPLARPAQVRWNWADGHDRHQVRRAVHQHARCAARVRAARHRVERRRREVPRADARLQDVRSASTTA